MSPISYVKSGTQLYRSSVTRVWVRVHWKCIYTGTASRYSERAFIRCQSIGFYRILLETRTI